MKFLITLIGFFFLRTALTVVFSMELLLDDWAVVGAAMTLGSIAPACFNVSI